MGGWFFGWVSPSWQKFRAPTRCRFSFVRAAIWVFGSWVRTDILSKEIWRWGWGLFKDPESYSPRLVHRKRQWRVSRWWIAITLWHNIVTFFRTRRPVFTPMCLGIAHVSGKVLSRDKGSGPSARYTMHPPLSPQGICRAKRADTLCIYQKPCPERGALPDTLAIPKHTSG